MQEGERSFLSECLRDFRLREGSSEKGRNVASALGNKERERRGEGVVFHLSKKTWPPKQKRGKVPVIGGRGGGGGGGGSMKKEMKNQPEEARTTGGESHNDDRKRKGKKKEELDDFTLRSPPCVVEGGKKTE